MKARYVLTFGILIGAGAIVGLAGKAHSQKQEAERVARLHDLMEGISKSNIGRLAAAVKGSGPSSDAEWDAIEMSGALLNEIGFLIDENNRAVDDVWKQASAQLRSGSADLVKAARAKDFAGVQKAFPAVGASCKTCHDVHKQ